MGAPLEGLRVVELARILAGPWIGQTLADLGAEVIKVEAPEGDDTRKWGPPFVEGAGEDGRVDDGLAGASAEVRGHGVAFRSVASRRDRMFSASLRIASASRGSSKSSAMRPHSAAVSLKVV